MKLLLKWFRQGVRACSIVMLVGVVLSTSCSGPRGDLLYSALPSEKSFITFSNDLVEDTVTNIANFAYMYNGGGVGVGDFNGDGWEDLFFTGNQVSSKLYLNRGDLTFEDVTNEAGVGTDRWCNGVSVVDINDDGWLDIYVSCQDVGDGRSGRNYLFVNEGVDQRGRPTFLEQAEAYGLTDEGFTVHASFFDFDRDGDLDVYLLRNHLEEFPQNTIRPKLDDGTGLSTDRLLRHDVNDRTGENSFVDVSDNSGISIEGYGLGIAVSDVNQDGWPDVYVANDFISDDFLWINQRDGTFKDESAWLDHTSRHGMGVDVADFNNDSRPDIFVLDMLPETDYRQKQMAAQLNYDYFRTSLQEGYQAQYVRNTLQLNNGALPGFPDYSFSEIGQLAGVEKTDWSWSGLFVDADNDGHKDLFVTNGYPHDITDMDFVAYGTNLTFGGGMTEVDLLAAVEKLPEVRINNYLFRNDGDLRFTNITSRTQISPSFSQGAAYVDLDNDGDLDLVTNNLNDEASLLINNTTSPYIQIELVGPEGNRDGFGVRASLYGGGKCQVLEHYPQRGYLSSVSHILHFGLGEEPVDSLRVDWPDRQVSIFQALEPNQRLQVRWSESVSSPEEAESPHQPVFKKSTARLNFKHKDGGYQDFYSNRLIPQRYSDLGPSTAVGDVNGDGKPDFIVGGSRRQGISLFTKDLAGGSFGRKPLEEGGDRKNWWDTGLELFDFDEDGDLDLYVAVGGNHMPAGDTIYQDRLYENTGGGTFQLTQNILPKLVGSNSSVSAADYDNDGDLDLFIGGYIVPRQFPLIPQSYLLRNDSGSFANVSDELPNGGRIGMISEGIWSDFDADGRQDLVLVGERMPITMIRNTPTKFEDVTPRSLSSNHGLWTTVVGADFDGDGDIDYIAGNMGLNHRFDVTPNDPLEWFVADFDENGSVDPVMSYTSMGSRIPYAPRDLLVEQLPMLKKRLTTYSQYANASLEDILSQRELRGAEQYFVNSLASCYVENLGGSEFDLSPLPLAAQFSEIQAFLVADYNEDGYLDVLVAGNNYGHELGVGQLDASKGLLLLGNGSGGFTGASTQRSGIHIGGDVRDLAMLPAGQSLDLILSTRHDDSLSVFEWKH